MSEEKKEQPKPAEQQEGKASEKKPEAKPKVEAKAEAKAEEKPKESKEGVEKKGKKVSRMALSEVEAGLKVVQEKMGGFQSNFAQHLLARKKILTESSKRP